MTGTDSTDTSRPIADYAMLSDAQSAALVGGDGSIDWLCLPRFDSPSIFGRILGPDAGHWSIRPADAFETRRRYVGPSLVLETQFETPTGMAMLTDALLLDGHERGHDIGASSPHVVARRFTVTEGKMRVLVELAPRPEYGVVRPLLVFEDGALVTRGGRDHLVLSGRPPDSIDIDTARWDFTLERGEDAVFSLHCQQRGTPARPWSPRKVRKLLADTEAAWRSWSDLHQSYDGPWHELVHHSGRVLLGLTHQPTGAIVAAPTTSLPERRGGSRNWDYRYCWVRDATLTLRALWVAACPHEAGRFLDWILTTAGSALVGRQRLQVMYGVGGEHDLSERTLDHLPGWCDSRPVRVGNAAWRQTQIDIYGELLDAVHLLRPQIGDIDDLTASLLAALADAAVAEWHQPDQGIWEMRGDPQHFLYSKLMCWVAVDRAIDLAEWLCAEDKVPAWERARVDIRDAIEDRGWNEELQAYTGTLDGDQLDASVLMMPITRFCRADEPRMLSTIEQVARSLSEPCGLLRRYRQDDGLEAGEGAFLLCSYWLSECFALAGDLPRARELFERVTAYANDVGLLSEEVEPLAGELLGNFPQAFSHIGLINAAWTIDTVERDLAASQSPPAKQ